MLPGVPDTRGISIFLICVSRTSSCVLEGLPNIDDHKGNVWGTKLAGFGLSLSLGNVGLKIWSFGGYSIDKSRANRVLVEVILLFQ